MQDELQPIKLTLWKQVKNHRQHLSNGTRGELLSRYRPAERAERSPFASPGSGPKIRNSNEGLWRKSLWDGDTWRRWGALLTQRKGGYAGLTAGGCKTPRWARPPNAGATRGCGEDGVGLLFCRPRGRERAERGPWLLQSPPGNGGSREKKKNRHSFWRHARTQDL